MILVIRNLFNKCIAWINAHIDPAFVLIAFIILILSLTGRYYFNGLALYTKTVTINPQSYRLDDPTLNKENSPLLMAMRHKIVAITIDDGPSNPKVDEEILAILKQHHARSMWFVNCRNFDSSISANATQNRTSLHEIANTGNLVENHSYTHSNLLEIDAESPENLRYEIADCSNFIEQIVGVRPIYFRPPFGKFNAHIKRIAEAAGMQLVLWSKDSIDYGFRNKSVEYAKLLLGKNEGGWDFADHVKDGDVILFHDTPQTAAVLDQLLTQLEARGFHFALPG